MTVRRIAFASLLAAAGALSAPFAAFADGIGVPNANALLTQPTLGPFGMAGIAAGAAGVLVLISRGRRKGGGD